ncbi:hypothetical protein [Hyalangium gracile]|uniref:hypothetical protein n=1 Tax=Hyalangium gracile TaxID=394092 RepID=UPI001CCE043A|nr:hypothetical protein [Hyalangium gracile]
MKAHDFKPWCHALVLTSLLVGCGGVEGGGDAVEDSNPEAVSAALATSARGRVTPEKHCVTRAQSLKPGAPLPEPSAAPPEDCFPTFSEAISFATRGAIRLPLTAKPADLKEEDLKAAPVPSGLPYAIGIGYTETGFSGSSIVFTAVENCGAILYASMPSGWNDAISSMQTFMGSRCRHSFLFEHVNFQGASLDCGLGCNSLGVLNKQTSSIFWTQ